MNCEKPYAVVRFLESETYSEVPSNWLYKEKNKLLCWWPTKINNITSSMINRTSPDETTWELCEIEVEKYYGKAIDFFINVNQK